ncbi:hypothetical protein P885DRAFT_40851 [Corynascus similis CBS 632.67]
MQSCSHTTMAVIYSRLKCMRCGQKPPLGILYRCVTDTEPLIHDANRRGAPVAFDEIGRRFSEKPTLGKFGADARRDAVNVLTELPTEQLSSYTLEQLDELISRRENVIANERQRVGHRTPLSARDKYPHDDKPWVPDGELECRHMVCPACHRIGREKSWVSLDTVLNGDVLPHVATAYSFSFMGSRPVCDAEIVKNIGCQPLPSVTYPRLSGCCDSNID